MLGLMYSAPADKTIESIIIDDEFINEDGMVEPEYIRKKVETVKENETTDVESGIVGA